MFHALILTGPVRWTFGLTEPSLEQVLVESVLSVLQPGLRDIFDSTRAVYFFGTPHLGSDWSNWHRLLWNLVDFVTPTHTSIIKLLQRGSEYLMNLQSQYNKISPEIKNISFYEEYPTPVVKDFAAVVRIRMLKLWFMCILPPQAR